MIRLALLSLVLGASAPAWAQQPPLPPYAPITLSEAAYKEITAWLLEQPTKFGAPVLHWLERQERSAQAGKPAPASDTATVSP